MICELFAVPAQSAREVIASPQLVRGLIGSLDQAGAGESLEKGWHGLHFTLTGSVWGGNPPLNFLVAGGESVADEDFGYGPPRIIHPDQMAELDSALGRITDEEFARRFDLARLAEEGIYPEIWDEPLDDLLEEYCGYLTQAKSLIGRAAREGHALLIVIR